MANMFSRDWDASKHADLDGTAVLVPLNHGELCWLHIESHVRQTCPDAKLVGLQRVQWPKLWGEFWRFREGYLSEKANERLLFHGMGTHDVADLFTHSIGLDPRFSKGGFYGHGVYLAENASYAIGGRHVHVDRMAGSGGTRMQLLLVRANLGVQEELSQRVDRTTEAMRMPNVRSDGPPGARFESVRAGPHRPFQSGTARSSIDASVIHVVYESRQLYPQYMLEIEFDLAPEVAASLASAAAEASPGSVGSSAASGSGAGSSSSSSTCPAPAGPPSKRARRSGPPGAPAAPAAAVPVAPPGDLTALLTALVQEGSPADKKMRVLELCSLLSAGEIATGAFAEATGGIEALVALLHDGSPEGKTGAGRALDHPSSNDDGRKASITAAGGIEALVSLLRYGSPYGKAVAAAVLHHLAENNDGRKESIALEGGIEALVALVRDGSPDGKAMAARVLHILSINDDGRKASIASAGGIEALVALLRDGSTDGKATAARALYHLSSNDDGRSASIAVAGGIEALVALVS